MIATPIQVPYTRPMEQHSSSKAAVCRQFHTEGFLGPYQLCSPDQMAIWRDQIENEILTGSSKKSDKLMSRHMDCQVIRDIVSQKSVLQYITNLLGSDILCWNTYLWNKEPGGLEIPWHQDIDYWPIEPPVTVSAWIAIDEVTIANSCPQIIPKSHKKRCPTLPSDGTLFSTMADPDHYDASEAIDMVMKPGEFFIFNERTLHHSNPNHSDKRRLGMSARYCPPWVLVNEQGGPLSSDHESLLVAGEDTIGLNKIFSL